MAVTVQMQFESAVTALYEDAFIGSSIENGTTIIQFDLRKLDFQRILETTSTICWCKAPYAVEVHELSTFHNPDSIGFRGWWKTCVSNRIIPPLALYCV